MGNTWNDEQISKKLCEKTIGSAEEPVFEKVWLKVEDRLGSRTKRFGGPVLWRPWAHPGGWVVVAACLCVILGDFQYQRNQADMKDLASFLITLSDPTAYAVHDSDEVKAQVLLAEPSTAITDIFLSDEDHPDPQPLL